MRDACDISLKKLFIWCLYFVVAVLKCVATPTMITLIVRSFVPKKLDTTLTLEYLKSFENKVKQNLFCKI